MLASLSQGTTRIKNLLLSDDILRTIEAFRAMGVKISIKRGESSTVLVQGVGMRGLKKPRKNLYLGNSGTSMRILPGILAGQDFEVVLTGDSSLSKRPMTRIALPLKKMGAAVITRHSHPPIKISGGKLKAIKYTSKIASAQVKSCILLAGLYAKGKTSVTEPVTSRDHTERMLRQFGVGCKVKGKRCEVKGVTRIKSPRVLNIPGDISSAAFFIVGAILLPGAKLALKNVGLNPTRTGILDILTRMAANIKIKNKTSLVKNGEVIGNILIQSSKLKGVSISAKEVVRAIDEIPIIMLAASLSKGKTVIKGVGELRVKETDRIKSMVTNLRKLGADIKPVKTKTGEDVIIKGCSALKGGSVSSYGDHRTAMAMLVAGLVSKGKLTVTGLSCINKSFPGFEKDLRKLR